MKARLKRVEIVGREHKDCELRQYNYFAIFVSTEDKKQYLEEINNKQKAEGKFILG